MTHDPMTQSHDILAILWPHDDLLISSNGNQPIRWLLLAPAHAAVASRIVVIVMT